MPEVKGTVSDFSSEGSGVQIQLLLFRLQEFTAGEQRAKTLVSMMCGHQRRLIILRTYTLSKDNILLCERTQTITSTHTMHRPSSSAS
ncbi:hypothetical protein GDO81_015539 [Engystomops pustulosus]|uniref:Uncharacterized protein n=1 Tax=Engystomops pustulosus TaxID=76066 RepID=A0AAV7ARU8_ENGPU|nr:hypothetical protein GDO81_015539 [Engystomops pustulosus]